MRRLKAVIERFQFKYVLPIVILPVLVYWRGLSVGFVADDFIWFETAISGPKAWLNFLAFLFRPSQVLEMIILHGLFGMEPTPIHFVSLAGHVACSVLVFYLARLLTGSPTKGCVAGLVFALFPRHHTVVLWMAANQYPVMTIFYLLAFLTFWLFLRRGHWAWCLVSNFSFLLAVSNHQTAATLPMLLFLAELMLWSETSSWGSLVKRLCQFRRYLKYAPMVIIVIAFRASALIVKQLPDVELIAGGYGYQSMGIRTISEFVKYIVYQIYPQIPLRSLDINLGTVVLAIGSLGLTGLLFWKGSNLERFLWLWVAIQFIPIVLFVPFGNDDRFFYLPSAGFAIILSLLLSRLYDFLNQREFPWPRALVAVLVGVWLISSVLIVNQRIEEWKVAGEMVQEIIGQVNDLHPEMDSEAQIYFVDMPIYYGRAYVIEPGIPSAIRIAYNDFGLSVRHSRETRISAALRSSDEGDQAIPGVLVFQYWDGKIEDRSLVYPRLKAVFEETFWYEW